MEATESVLQSAPQTVRETVTEAMMQAPPTCIVALLQAAAGTEDGEEFMMDEDVFVSDEDVFVSDEGEFVTDKVSLCRMKESS